MTKKSEGKTQLEETKEMEKKLLFMLEESIPDTQTGRAEYVSSIALFYSMIFKHKLQHFIGLQLEELAQIGRTELGTNIIRSNISCFRLIDEWMEKMTNEHFGNLEEKREKVSFEDSANFIRTLDEKYNGKI